MPAPITAIVVPTNRPEKMKDFEEAWKDELKNVYFIKVWDTSEEGKQPTLEIGDETYTTKEIMEEASDTITSKCAYIRNLGFAFIALRLPHVKYIVTFDDDVTPVGDTIGDHIKALNTRVPISWMSVGDEFTRGFPYGIRDEAQVMVSHGVWYGDPDHDSATQLIKGLKEMTFLKTPVPKGVYFPMSGMNLAFRSEMLPYMYQSPRLMEMNRMGDIWGGITAKRILDEKGWACVTGYSAVHHARASNVWTNFRKESLSLEQNEYFWQNSQEHPYFKEYKKLRLKYQEFISEKMHRDSNI
jgi:hypothetical protein